MSDDLIKRSDAIKALDNAWINGTSLLDANEAVKQLNDLPSADRPQGEWIVHKARTEVNDGFIDFFPTEYECSNCGLKQSMYFINSKPSNFCPNCGASMKGADDDSDNI